MTIEIRALTEDEEEPAHRLRSQAFGVKHEPLDPDRPRRDPDRDPLLGAWDGDRLVAAGHAGAVGQWFGGRSVPMGAGRGADSGLRRARRHPCGVRRRRSDPRRLDGP